MPDKGRYDLDSAYKIACECHPGEVAKFCCDLGEMWLFKFSPANGETVIDGHFGFVVDKESGKVGQYDMLENMSKIEGKNNLVKLLKH